MVLAAIGAALAHGPILPETPARAPILAAVRIAFGLLLIVRLQRLRAARCVLWPASRAWRVDRWLPIERVISLWQVLAALVAVGLFTAAAAGGCLVLGVYVFRRAFTHSLEDVLWQHTACFLCLVGAGEMASLDALLGLGAAGAPALALDLWWLGLAVLMCSAGFEKLFSPLWRRGLGFPLFVGLPHLVQPRFRFVRRLRWSGRAISYGTIVCELGLLATAAHAPSRLAVSLLLLGFAISLFVVVDLSFIGQTLALVLSGFIAIDAAALLSPPAAPIDPARSLDAATLAWILAGSAPIVAGCFAAVPGRAGRALTWVARLTVGLEPIRVFTDSQLHGIYLYRVLAHGSSGPPRSVVPAFTDDGGPGPLQRWHPRVFLKLTYEVTDLCLAASRRGWDGVRSSLAYEATTALLDAGLAALSPTERAALRELTLEVRSVELVDEPSATFAVGPWQPLLSAPVSAGQRGEVRPAGPPPSLSRTARAGATA